MSETTDEDSNDLQNECEQLQKRYHLLQKELCLVKQDLLDNENQYSAAKERETCHLHEIEHLKKKETSEIENLEHQIKHVGQVMKDEVMFECVALDEEIEKYKELIFLNKSQFVILGETVEEAVVDDALIEFKNNLQDELTRKLTDKDDVQILNTNLKTLFSNVQTELEQLKENCNSVGEEILEAETVLTTLEEELMISKNELALMKPILVHVNDNNSLFAEVNDRRVELRKSLDIIRSKCSDIKNEVAITQKELSNIKFLNEELSNYSKLYEEECDKNMRTLSDAYLSRFQTLDFICSEYNKDILTQQNLIKNGLPSDTLEFLNKLESKKQKINAKIENEKGTQFRAQKMMFLQLKSVQLKVDEVKQMITNQLQPKMMNLKITLEAISNQRILDKRIMEETENKENDKENCPNPGIVQKDNKITKATAEIAFKSKPELRKVTFTDDVAQTKCGTLKAGGKKIPLKSVHISNFMKK